MGESPVLLRFALLAFSSVLIIVNPFSTAPRFVTMTEGADSAIAQLSGSEMHGRTLTVNEARPMVKREFGGGGGGGGKGRGRY